VSSLSVGIGPLLVANKHGVGLGVVIDVLDFGRACVEVCFIVVLLARRSGSRLSRRRIVEGPDSGPSRDCHPAINDQDLTGDVSTCRGDQEQHRCCELGRVAGAVDKPSASKSIYVAGPKVAGHFGLKQASTSHELAKTAAYRFPPK
jgi:hypothetical protein